MINTIINFIKKNKLYLIVAILILAVGALIYLYEPGNDIKLSESEEKAPEDAEYEEEQDIPMDLEDKAEQPNMNSNLPKEPVKESVKVKGIYVSGWVAGTKSRLNQLIDLINATELNSMVIDVKEDDGRITYESNIRAAQDMGAPIKMIGDINQLISDLKENNIYPIARIVCFKDPTAAEKRPDLSVKTKDGSIWRDRKGTAWLNPYNREAWEYIIEISKEAAELGFREIQYDYIRFPTDGDVSRIDYGQGAESLTKAEAIAEFLSYAKKELAPLGVDVSADIFGIVPIVEGDYEAIGQDWEMVSQDVDYVCPMVYPSHYANVAQNGVGQKINNILYPYPDLDPYGVVYNTLFLAQEKIRNSQVNAKIRPWLQAFTASYLGRENYQVYGGEQIRAQIQASYDAGLESGFYGTLVTNTQMRAY